MASRLAVDASGRRIVVQTTDTLEIAVGTVFLLLGDSFQAGPPGGIQWTGKTGRPPTT